MTMKAGSSVDERRAVGLHVTEMPIEAALGDAEATAQPPERQSPHAVLGEHPETLLHPVIYGEPGIGCATRCQHGR